MTIVRTIRTANQQWAVRQAGGYKTWVNTVLDQRWQGARADWSMTGAPVLAQVVHGDWITPCLDCAESIIVQPGEPFYCPNCQNVLNNGKSRTVIFPPNQEEIEMILLARPMPENRNWLPGETAEQLQEENREHGVPDTWHG